MLQNIVCKRRLQLSDTLSNKLFGDTFSNISNNVSVIFRRLNVIFGARLGTCFTGATNDLRDNLSRNTLRISPNKLHAFSEITC